VSGKLPKSVPIGRIDDLKARDDAHLIAYTVSDRTMTFDVKVTRYASRKALAAFVREGSRHYALVRDVVDHPSKITNRNLQRVVRDD
jgi:hypothetical protein